MKNPDVTPDDDLSKVSVKLLDPLGKSIEGLKYQVREGQKIVAKGVTDGRGQISSFMSRIGTELTVHVERFASEEMKQIKTLRPWAENFRVKILSGKVKEEIPLVKAKGAPGNYERKTYIVKKGDTLGLIASKNATSAQVLASLNNIKLEAIIHPGQVLKLPLKRDGAAGDDSHPALPSAGPAKRPEAAPAPRPAPILPGPAKVPAAPPVPAAPAKAPSPVTSTPAKLPAPVPTPVPAPAAKTPPAKPAAPKTIPISGPVPTSTVDERGENGTPKSTVNMVCDQSQCIKLGDSGPLVEEINVRLMGFGGTASATAGLDHFSARTESAVKQFQRDFMGVGETGKVCGAVLRALDQFRADYHINISAMRCPCRQCDGFGHGYVDSSAVNIRHAGNFVPGKEYPGFHRGLLWLFRAALFYIHKKDKSLGYTFFRIASAYRCWHDNRAHVDRRTGLPRKTVNHMGLALDLQFYKNGGPTRITGADINNLRRDIFIRRIGAKLGVREANFAWLETAAQGADSWVHVDLRSLSARDLVSRYFVTTQAGCDGESIVEMARKAQLLKLINCGGVPKKPETPKTDRIPIEKLRLSDKAIEFIKGWEKYKKLPYNDSKHYCTVGIGHLIAEQRCEILANQQHPEYEKFKTGVSEEAAREMLQADLKTTLARVAKCVFAPLYQQEYDALVCLAFNCGGLKKFTKLLDKVNTFDYEGCCREFGDITNKGTDGLVKRRKSEMAIFRHGVYDSTH